MGLDVERAGFGRVGDKSRTDWGCHLIGRKTLLFPCQEQSWCGVVDLPHHIWFITPRDLISFVIIVCHSFGRHHCMSLHSFFFFNIFIGE